MTVRCENCKGKGHVLDGAAATLHLLTVVLAPVIFFARNDPDNPTRKPCLICDGTGRLKVCR